MRKIDLENRRRRVLTAGAPHPPQAIPLLLKEKACKSAGGEELNFQRRVAVKVHSDEPHGRPPLAARK